MELISAPDVDDSEGAVALPARGSRESPPTTGKASDRCRNRAGDKTCAALARSPSSSSRCCRSSCSPRGAFSTSTHPGLGRGPARASPTTVAKTRPDSLRIVPSRPPAAGVAPTLRDTPTPTTLTPTTPTARRRITTRTRTRTTPALPLLNHPARSLRARESAPSRAARTCTPCRRCSGRSASSPNSRAASSPPANSRRSRRASPHKSAPHPLSEFHARLATATHL